MEAMWPFNRLNRRLRRFKARPLRGNERVAIMLLSVAPQLAAAVYEHLTPVQIREINKQMTGMIYLEDSQRIEIISSHMGIILTPELKSRRDLLSVVIAALEAFIRTDARRAAQSFEMQLDNWPRGPQSSAIQDTRKPLDVVNKAAGAAVFLICLPPELSAQLFSELEPVTVQRITWEIIQLPLIPDETRSRAIRHFLELEGSDHSLSSLLVTAESVVGANPAKSAKRLLEAWPTIA
jgi:flagellar motor switch protein FliG